MALRDKHATLRLEEILVCASVPVEVIESSSDEERGGCNSQSCASRTSHSSPFTVHKATVPAPQSAVQGIRSVRPAGPWPDPGTLPANAPIPQYSYVAAQPQDDEDELAEGHRELMDLREVTDSQIKRWEARKQVAPQTVLASQLVWVMSSGGRCYSEMPNGTGTIWWDGCQASLNGVPVTITNDIAQTL